MDVRPKIDFDNAQYRLQVPTGNLGNEDDTKSDPPELAYGIGGDRERGLTRPFLNGLSRWRPKPTKEQSQQWALEEPKLIAKAVRGDCHAAQLLVERHLYGIQAKAWRAWRKVNPARKVFGNRDLVPDTRRPNAIEIDDLVASTFERFWVSITRFKLTSNNGLNAYVRAAIDGAISDGMRDWHNKEGFSGADTRLRRFLLNEGHRRWPLEMIQLKFPKYTPEEIGLQLEVSVTESYTEVAVIDENGDEQSTDDPLAAARSPSSQWSRQAALSYRWPKKHHARSVFGYEVVGSARGGLAHGEYGSHVQPWSYRRKRYYGSLWNDKAIEQSERKERLLLEWMGRRRYANYLVEKDRARPSNSEDYDVHWMGMLANTEKRPTPAALELKVIKNDEWKPRVPRQRIRAWRAA